MLTIKKGTITHMRGDTGVLQFEIVDGSGTHYDMQEKDTLIFTIADRLGGDILLQKTVNGTSRFIIQSADTIALAPGRYVYDVQLNSRYGAVSTIAGPATYVLKQDVTNTISNTNFSGSDADVEIAAVFDLSPLKGDKGEQGPVGRAGTMRVGSVSVGTPAVSNSGTASDAVLNFTLPAGVPGPAGRTATVQIGSVTSGRNVSVENIGTPTDAILNFVLAKGDKGEQGNVGPVGPEGKRATIKIGEVTAGSSADVYNSGTQNDAILNFTLPKGDKGDRGEQGIQGIPGEAPNIRIGNVSRSDTPRVTARANEDKSEVVVDFELPKGDRGDDATVVVGSVTSGPEVSITNSGTPGHAVLDFTLPKGDKGEKGDIGITPSFSIGLVNKGDVASASISGSAEKPILNLVLPRGDKGIQGVQGLKGDKGDAATIKVGKVSAGEFASVTNVGTAEEAVFDITLPRGEKGETGSTGATPTIHIGTVTMGEEAGVTIAEGSTPENITLNFIVPQPPKLEETAINFGNGYSLMLEG